VVIAEMATGPVVLGLVPHPPLSRAALAGIAQVLAQDNAGRPPGLWVLDGCPVRREAIELHGRVATG